MISKYSVKKPFTVFVAIIIVLILGVVSFTKMRVDLIPSINLPYAVVITSYIGASPEQVETVVTDTLESTLASLDNLDTISSISAEHMSLIILAFDDGTNMDTAMIEMRESLDMVTGYLPETVTSPMIMKINPDMMPAMVTAVSTSGMTDAESATFIEDRIIPEIESVAGIASVTATGLIENYVSVTISGEKIDAMNASIEAAARAQYQLAIDAQIAQTLPEGMTFEMLPAEQQQAIMENIPSFEDAVPLEKVDITKDMISGILTGQNFSMPAGTAVSEDKSSYMIRVGDEIASVDELKNLTLFALDAQTSVKLSDVCEVVEFDNMSQIYSKINGDHGIMLTLSKQPDYSTAEVTNAVLDKIEKIESDYENVSFYSLMNQGDYVNLMVDTIISNLVSGGVLAIIVLILFLKKIKPTLVVGASIVISVITTFVLMYFSGITLNMLSMSGLALGVGMLVDNSIVVIENIFRLRNEGKSMKEACIEGAKEVAGAITASTLTTIVVFVPIMFTSGLTLDLFIDMALTIGYSLIASLVVALTLVPAVSSRMKDKGFISENKTFDKIANGYSKFLGKCLKRKALVIVTCFVLLVVFVAAGVMQGAELFPQMNTGSLSITVTLPESYSDEEVFESLDSLYEILDKHEEINTIGIMHQSGTNEMSAMMSMMGAGTTVYVLLDEEYYSETTRISEEISKDTENLPFEVAVSSANMDMSMLTGAQISIGLYSNDLDNLKETAIDLSEKLLTVEGVETIETGLEETNNEYRVIVDKDKAISQGLTVAQVYMAVAEKLAAETSSAEITDNDIKYSVFVRDDRDVSYTVETIGDIELAGMTGNTVKVSDVAEITLSQGFTTIVHSNQDRTMSLSGTIKSGYDVTAVNNNIKEFLETYDMPSGTRAVVSGESEVIAETFEDLFLMLGLAIVFIYLVMVAQFQSLKSPFIIMFTIPLAFTGGFMGLLICGMKLSVISLIGFILLVGIVVNNGIVFVDYANQKVEQGMELNEALIITGKHRLRPIIMTALTTIVAMLMMVFDTSSGGEMMKPLAVTATGGLIYATLLTLVLVPCLYAIFNKKKAQNTQKVTENEAAAD